VAATPGRRCAHAVLRRVLREGAFADRSFRAEADRAGLDPRERAFAQRLAYGTIQRLRTIDWVIERLSDRPLDEIDPPVLDALRLGILQVVWLDAVPAHAAVDQTVELAAAEAPRSRGFVNALMRRAAAEAPELVAALPDGRPEEAALKHSHPDWLAAAWWEALGPADTRALMARDNEPAESALRVNTLRAARDEVLDELHARGVAARPAGDLPEGAVLDDPFDVHGSDLFHRGLVMPQSRGSMLVGRVVDPQPGERVLDLCSAPGAKTTHLAALMGGRGEIVSVEANAARAEELRANCARLGATIVDVRTTDAREPVEVDGFDRVLLDAPCSDLGTLQSRPDARWRKTPEIVTQLAVLQRELIEVAASQLRAGGVLVYSTCTISPLENRAPVEELLSTHPELSVDDLDADWPSFSLRSDRRYVQLLPFRDGTDGFFIARLRRIGGGEARGVDATGEPDS
jgi:16S rRNA (cytosine967-C5)-methyltransferase